MEEREPTGIDEMIGDSGAFKMALRQAIDVAKSEGAVLIVGEAGTGKELMARAIHRMGKRHRQSFLKIDCLGGAPAFFGAGLCGADFERLKASDRGTLLLKHIEKVAENLQGSVLRLMNKQEFASPGGTTSFRIDVRVLATASDLGLTVRDSWLRKNLSSQTDLRILHIPPLREREGDIPLLAWYFVKKWAKVMSKSIDAISPSTLESLVSYGWPNNVRELEFAIERGVRSTKGAEMQAEFPSSAA